MPTWKSQFLKQAISSIVSQSNSDWELVVVDDCSPDPIQDIVASFNNPQIRYVRNQTNIGRKDLVRQWNHSITFARGEFVVLASDDDVYKENFCAECVRLMSKYPNVDLIRSSVEEIDENGKHMYNDYIPAEFTSKYEYLNLWMTGRIYTCIGNFAFRRSSLLDSGGFVSFPCAFGSDVATPIILSANGVANSSERLFCFRISHLHLSSDSTKFIEKIEAISLLSEWLKALKYTPKTMADKELYSVMDTAYLHQKVIYDYFNLVIRFLPFNKMYYLKFCRLATPFDKIMMIMRWVKNNFQHNIL